MEHQKSNLLVKNIQISPLRTKSINQKHKLNKNMSRRSTKIQFLDKKFTNFLHPALSKGRDSIEVTHLQAVKPDIPLFLSSSNSMNQCSVLTNLTYLLSVATNSSFPSPTFLSIASTSSSASGCPSPF